MARREQRSHRAPATAVDGEDGVPLARGRDDHEHEADQGEDLEVCWRAVDRAVSVEVQPMAVPGAHSGSTSSGVRRAAREAPEARPDQQQDHDPDAPAMPPPSRSSSTPLVW